MDLNWEDFERAVRNCRRCNLCAGRTHAVPGEGARTATLMLVGEGPGYREDMEGRPFVGPAGQLLDRMLAAIELDRESVYIANIVKCRPPSNRDPMPEECDACLPYLRAQFLLVRPKVILCLGRISAQRLISPELSITRAHGEITKRKDTYFMPTFHPAALLRNANLKRDAWNDLQKLRDLLQGIATGNTESIGREGE